MRRTIFELAFIAALALSGLVSGAALATPALAAQCDQTGQHAIILDRGAGAVIDNQYVTGPCAYCGRTCTVPITPNMETVVEYRVNGN